MIYSPHNAADKSTSSGMDATFKSLAMLCMSMLWTEPMKLPFEATKSEGSVRHLSKIPEQMQNASLGLNLTQWSCVQAQGGPRYRQSGTTTRLRHSW